MPIKCTGNGYIYYLCMIFLDNETKKLNSDGEQLKWQVLTTPVL